MKRHAQLHDITANPESCPALKSNGCLFKSFRKDKLMIHVSKHHPWLVEGGPRTTEVRKKELEDVAFGNPMAMANPPNTTVTQSLATLPISSPTRKRYSCSSPSMFNWGFLLQPESTARPSQSLR